MNKTLIWLLVLLLLLTGCTEAVPAPQSGTVTADQTLTVHFIDVGQADCALLEYGGAFMLIDGGNKEDGSLVISYLEQQGVEELAYVVCTHAHEDHVGGLPSVLAVYPTGAVYAPTRTYASNVFDDFMYYVNQQDLEVTIPAPGDTFSLGEVELTVLGPVENYAETNDTSLVILAQLGDTRFLFTGDMETAAENDMLDYWGSRVSWDVDVLKAGHHGSNTSSGYRFLYETAPESIVISVGTDNSYGHPHEEILSRYRDAGATVYRTDRMGTVLAVSDGSRITFTWEDQTQEPEDAEPADEAQAVYIGNKNSKKVHAATCGSLPKEENRVLFSSLEEALEAGYTLCGSCLD